MSDGIDTVAVEEHRPPGPGRQEFVKAFRANPLDTVLDLQKNYGDIVVYEMRRIPGYLLSHPDYVREVLVTQSGKFVKGFGLQDMRVVMGDGLVTSDGDFHRRQRRLAQPAMHHQRLLTYSEVMGEFSKRYWGRWQPGQTIEVDYEMTQLAMSVVAKTLFDIDLDEGEGKRVRDAAMTLSEGFNYFTLPSLQHRRQSAYDAAVDLNRLVYGFIEDHRSSGEDRGDLLSMLIMATDDEVAGDQMNDRQVRDEAVTILLTGHETSAKALTWTWYLLSQHPEIEARFHQEVDEVLEGRLPTHMDLPRLEYTRKVLTESMRVYPPVWLMDRVAVADVQIGDYVIHPGSMVFVSQWVTHHDERWWPEPFRFDPDRWTPEAEDQRPKYAYFPFGGGPRLCYGEAFTWMETMLALVTIAQRWKLRLVPDHPVEPQPRVTIRPKHGMMMTVEPRG
ncbi:MAG TPA: cytochrome P450 [Actinomycetota bacterium]|nr:cytochrome P450 [Actinomycetota bacterium]